MDRNSYLQKRHQSKLAFKSHLKATGNSQDIERWSLRDMGIVFFPGSSTKDSGLKVLLQKSVNEGLLELVGAHFQVKGHAKGRKKSGSKKRKTSKKGGKKGSKGRKKSGSKRKASKKAKDPESPKQ